MHFHDQNIVIYSVFDDECNGKNRFKISPTESRKNLNFGAKPKNDRFSEVFRSFWTLQIPKINRFFWTDIFLVSIYTLDVPAYQKSRLGTTYSDRCGTICKKKSRFWGVLLVFFFHSTNELYHGL